MIKTTTILIALLSLLLAMPVAAAPQEGYGYQKPPPLRPSDPPKVVSQWLKRHLWAPDSYESIDFSAPVYMPYGWHFAWAIRHLYIYQHPEYGKMIADDIFYFDPEGYVAGRSNTGLWRNQARPVPEWGWGWEKWGPEGKQPLSEEWDRIRDNVGW